MVQLWPAALAVVAGFVGLIWSADRFVSGSASIAHNLGISKLIIGLTIVAFGTSAPEVVVSISASLRQAGDLAIGNALGSNIANISLVLAVTALIAPLPIQRHLLNREVPALILITAVSGLFLYDSRLVNWEGWCLLALLPAVMGLLIWTKRNDPKEIDTHVSELGKKAAIGWFVLGLALLVLSSEILVWGAEQLALAAGVTPLVVGLTVVALGTSLPELATSVVSALKGHQDLALGNIIGSNLFNLLAVMAIPGILQSLSMESEVFYRDYFAMALVTGLLVMAIFVDFGLRREKTGTLNSHPAYLGGIVGSLLLICYLGYYLWLILSLR